jgi:hypothetical protein
MSCDSTQQQMDGEHVYVQHWLCTGCRKAVLCRVSCLVEKGRKSAQAADKLNVTTPTRRVLQGGAQQYLDAQHVHGLGGGGTRWIRSMFTAELLYNWLREGCRRTVLLGCGVVYHMTRTALRLLIRLGCCHSNEPCPLHLCWGGGQQSGRVSMWPMQITPG